MDEFAELGGKLKQVREARGISLEDVQAHTKIPIDILRSIERDEKVIKISPIYLKGFLKIYSKFLGVELPQDKKEHNVFSPSADKKSGSFKKQEIKLSLGEKVNFSLWFKIAVTSIILIILIFLGIKLSHKRKNILKESPKVSNVTDKTPAKAPAKVAPNKVSVSVQPPKTTRIKLAVRAKENTWLQVKLDGRIVFRQILKKGTSESWVAKDRFELSIGNAAALDLELNNKIISPLGRHGQALKNVLITKDGLTVVH